MMNTKRPNAEKKIHDAFIELLQTNGFSHLTVKAVIETAHVNRSTFYSHYLDKYDLMNKLESDLLYQTLSIIHSNSAKLMYYQDLRKDYHVYPVVTDLVKLVADNFSLFGVLMGPNGDPKFYGKVKSVLLELIDFGLMNRKGSISMSPSIPDHYARELIVYQILDIINIWLEETPPPPRKK